MQPNEFVVGRRYRNRTAWYEVLAIEGQVLRVRYDTGQEAQMPAETAARIFNNMEREDANQIPRGIASPEDFAWTVGVIARHGELQADVPPQSLVGFRADYRQATGENPVHGVNELSSSAGKWGCENRIYIREDVTIHPRFALPANVEVSAGNQPGIRRINKNDFWWHLVGRLGFRLGRNQNCQAIREVIPPQLQTAFDEGVNYMP